MLKSIGRSSLAGMLAGTLVLGGCATTDSVKRAQETADQALSTAQAAQTAAQRAQSSADAAASAAQQAQTTADSANSAAQAAQSTAQATGARVDEMEAQKQRMHTRRHRRGATSSGAAAPGERG
jgi:hypothetical protein